ncbi:MAG: hypothetical protein ACI9TK_001539 [Flavobacteriaceae bacterium]|jgi:hypothetical protein
MINKRYLPPALIEAFLKQLPISVSVKIIGHSVEMRPISLLSIGSGNTKILLWSQMHGNESTTTKALFDFIPWFLEKEQKVFQEKFTLNIILQLNPDGAAAYTRLNFKGIDLNRDAILLSQPESKVLRDLYQSFQPDYCLNLHGQRTVFAAGKNGLTASLSFLAPSADVERTITPARKKAMECIVAIKKGLENDIPNQIGRYDDAFNANCVGDTFSKLGTPTLLFEAGHFPGDYQREVTRMLILKSYKLLFQSLLSSNENHSVEEYMAIPENSINFIDLLVTGVTIKDKEKLIKAQQLGICYEERLVEGIILFFPIMEAYGDQISFKAHRTINLPVKLTQTPLFFEVGKSVQKEEFTKLFSINT